MLDGESDDGVDRFGVLAPSDWAAVDAALGNFTAASVIPLLAAAIDAPWTRPWQYHLTLLWTRAVSVPPTGAWSASNADLNDLVSVAVEVGRHPVLPPGKSNDPRHPVGFTIAGRRWRLHPGDHLYPLMLLRRLATTARAVDDTLLHTAGFTLTDVIEVALAHGDSIITRLAEAWTTPSSGDRVEDTSADDAGDGPVVSAAEVDAVMRSAAEHGDPRWLAARCSEPERAARVLDWFTQDADHVALADTPGLPLLGPILRLRTADAVLPVPASLALDALNAAADMLLRRPEIGAADAARLQALTYAHAYAVFNRRVTNRSAAQELDLSSPPVIVGQRTVATVVTALHPDTFAAAFKAAIDVLAQRAADPDGWHVLGLDSAQAASAASVDHSAKVIVYGGPLSLTLHHVRDVILLHIEELVELVDAAGGDWATVEYFLQDLGEHTGHDLVVFQDILDVWTAWRDWGRIGPPPGQNGSGTTDAAGAEDETVLLIRAADYDTTWAQAAGWEPIDAVLAATGIPEHRDWPFASIDADGTANLFTTPNGTIALVNTDPAVIILIDGSDAATMHLDADTFFSFADGVRSSITRQPETAAHFRLPDAPVVISLQLTEERVPDSDRGHGLRAACSPEHAVLDLIIGPDVLELFATDPLTGHDVIGVALHELVRRVRAGRAEPPGTPAAAFQDAWQQVGPLMTLHTVADGRPATAPVDTLPRTPAIQARALRAVADRVLHRAVPGTYTDADAHAVCRNTLLPTIEEVMHERIAACGPSLLRSVAVRLNAAYATHLRRDHQITHALAGPWADNWHDAARDNDRAVNVSALRTLLEAVLANPPAGNRIVDALELGELAALANLLVHTATTDYGFQRDIHGLQLDIDNGGVFTVQRTPMAIDERGAGDPPLDIDLAAYHRAQLDHLIAAAAQHPWTISDVTADAARAGARLPLAAHQRERLPFHPLATIAPPTLLKVDTLLSSGWGTGLDGLDAVLSTATDWPPDDDGIVMIHPDDLVREAADWSNLPEAQIRAALVLLQLDAGAVEQDGERRFLNVEQRSHRLPTRPLPSIDGQVLIMPWVLYAAHQLHSRYIEAARLPQPASALPPGVINAMTEHRQGHNRELETMVRDIVTDLGLAHRFQFDMGEQARAGILAPIGEIDLLIADPVNARLWVCEVKDLVTPYSIAKVRNHVRKFTHGRNGGIIAKLLAKCEQIQQHARAVAHECGVTADVAWRTVPLIVTRHVDPAAYTRNPAVPFTLPHLLLGVLQDHVDPEAGSAPNA
ncbi:hypothetical protein AB0H83_23265 [Dactylosporangium sp. NPDC050688]|uniref:hypothetical protein n=1 Tax=Dactylosporangium sp. NPDC050688 TaxID=3157217 RepID=UPI0033F55657